MPNLELLAIKISKLIPDTWTIGLSSPPQRRKVALPQLRAINVTAQDLEIYATFLDRIVPSRRCALGRREEPTQTVTARVQEMTRIFSHYLNNPFDYRRSAPYPMTEFSLAILPDVLHLMTYNRQFYLRLISAAGEGIPDHGLEEVLNTISVLKFPNTISQLHLFLISDTNTRFISTTPLRLFLALGSVTELITFPTCLSYLAGLSGSETSILFPSLKIVFLSGLNGLINKAGQIKPFLVDRQRSAPIEVLDLSKSHWPLGDLRFLDEITGLKVVWVQDNIPVEYVCGSGNPEMLSLGRDDIDSDVESD